MQQEFPLKNCKNQKVQEHFRLISKIPSMRQKEERFWKQSQNSYCCPFCYSQHSHLLFNNTYLSSQSGVQQGDPLGPLLFSLALWPIKKLKQNYQI